MNSLWRRIERFSKKATKFKFIFTFEELMIEGTSKW